MAFETAYIIAPQDSGVRRIVDPDGTLPRVAFVTDGAYDPDVDFDFDGRPLYGFDITCASGTVGKAHLGRREEDAEIYFGGIRIDKDDPKYEKGMGLAAYLVAIETAHYEDYAFATDRTVSMAAKRVWDTFIGIGIARLIKPFEPFMPEMGLEEPFEGHARIDPIS